MAHDTTPSWLAAIRQYWAQHLMELQEQADSQARAQESGAGFAADFTVEALPLLPEATLPQNDTERLEA